MRHWEISDIYMRYKIESFVLLSLQSLNVCKRSESEIIWGKFKVLDKKKHRQPRGLALEYYLCLEFLSLQQIKVTSRYSHFIHCPVYCYCRTKEKTKKSRIKHQKQCLNFFILLQCSIFIQPMSLSYQSCNHYYILRAKYTTFDFFFISMCTLN